MFKLVLIGTAACFALVAVSANAQPAAQKDIVGTWAFVSNTADLAGKQVELAFCPERIAEGRALEELASIPQIIGGIDKHAHSASANTLQ